MTAATTAVSTQREPELLGQTVVVIGGSAGIGLETARRARAEGASVILTGRNPERLKQAALELDAQSTAAFDANDPASLQSFFQHLPTPIDHVMVTAGAPHYGPPLEMPPEKARRGLTEHLLLALGVARGAADKVRPPGSLVFMGGTGARRVDDRRSHTLPPSEMKSLYGSITRSAVSCLLYVTFAMLCLQRSYAASDDSRY
jgi:NAD(P)-dependent dehydrogenase (short-subunit alcohol dehydrogenase family)